MQETICIEKNLFFANTFINKFRRINSLHKTMVLKKKLAGNKIEHLLHNFSQCLHNILAIIHLCMHVCMVGDFYKLLFYKSEKIKKHNLFIVQYKVVAVRV